MIQNTFKIPKIYFIFKNIYVSKTIHSFESAFSVHLYAQAGNYLFNCTNTFFNCLKTLILQAKISISHGSDITLWEGYIYAFHSIAVYLPPLKNDTKGSLVSPGLSGSPCNPNKLWLPQNQLGSVALNMYKVIQQIKSVIVRKQIF